MSARHYQKEQLSKQNVRHCLLLNTKSFYKALSSIDKKDQCNSDLLMHYLKKSSISQRDILKLKNVPSPYREKRKTRPKSAQIYSKTAIENDKISFKDSNKYKEFAHFIVCNSISLNSIKRNSIEKAENILRNVEEEIKPSSKIQSRPQSVCLIQDPS